VDSAYGTFGRIEASGQADFWGHFYSRGYLRYPGRATTTGSANLVVKGGYHSVSEVTSVRSSKVNIENVDDNIAPKILDLNPREWIDRAELEEALGDQIRLIEDTPEGPRVDESWAENLCDGGTPRRVPGLVAEEVLEAGLDHFVTYRTNPE